MQHLQIETAGFLVTIYREDNITNSYWKICEEASWQIKEQEEMMASQPPTESMGKKHMG